MQPASTRFRHTDSEHAAQGDRSSDKLVAATSCDNARQVRTSCDQSDNMLSQAPTTFWALSEVAGTFREKRQTTGNNSKMTHILKIVGLCIS